MGFLQKVEQDAEEHDVSKELFLGIMMLMLCLGILILNVASPVWRVHQHDPEEGDLIVVYTGHGYGLSRDGIAIDRELNEWSLRRRLAALVSEPETDLHLINRGGSRETVVRHAALADSLLSTALSGRKVRTAVYMHGW
ncbi:MAG: hypothetical protein O2782_12740 [bacterium]|nr:hypothetical protein [bacterium]